jgi:glycerol-3-phosphate cytidylyltransferase-like family protein
MLTIHTKWRNGVIVRGHIPLVDVELVNYLENCASRYEMLWILLEETQETNIVPVKELRQMLEQLACVSYVALNLKECPPEFDVIILPHSSLTRLTKLLRNPIPQDDLIPPGCTDCEVLTRRPEPLTLLTGCFDLIHPGHYSMIEMAGRFGCRPVIAALTTSGIRVQPKNRGDRPLCCMTDRVTVLRAHRVRPFVFLFDGPDSLSLIERLKPNFFIKEERDRMRSIVQKEARLVERLGGQVIWYTGQSRLTSSRLAARIRNSL